MILCRALLVSTSVLLLSAGLAVGQEEEPTEGPPAAADEQRPEVRDRIQAMAALDRALRRHGLAANRGRRCRARPVLWLFVDEEGTVTNAKVYQSSGSARIDTIAMEGARDIRFRPALKGEQPVPVWVRQRLELTLRCPENL